MALLLSSADVSGLLDLPQALEVTRRVLREQAADAVVAVPPRHIAVPHGALRLVSGALVDSQRLGIRVGPATFPNPSGEERMVALLYEGETGELLSIMAYPFGRLRTG